jgi:hypothetical protein
MRFYIYYSDDVFGATWKTSCAVKVSLELLIPFYVAFSHFSKE